jgi:hypothetical protein
MAQSLSVTYAKQDVNTVLIHPMRRSMEFSLLAACHNLSCGVI